MAVSYWRSAGGEMGSIDVNGPGLEQVLATTDGGASWSEVLHREPPAGQPITRLRFTGPMVGWLATGGCHKMGANGPCGGSLSVTLDGGRTWAPGGAPPAGEAILFSVVGRAFWSAVSYGAPGGRPSCPLPQ